MDEHPLPRPRTADRRLAVVLLWSVTRLLLVSTALKIGPLRTPGPLDYSVSFVYHGWDRIISAGRFPLHDNTWQYPPGAAGPLLGPHLLPFLDYDHGFVVCCLLVDALVLVLLLRAARSAAGGGPGGGPGSGPGTGLRGALGGAWLWTAGLPLLWTVPWTRFDLAATALAVAALLCARSGLRRSAGPSTYRRFGTLVALGLLVKVWPVLLLAGTPRGRATRTAWTVAAGVSAACALVLYRTMPGAFDFLSAQGERGIQYEAVGALPFHLARHLGWSGTVQVQDGSTEFLGPWVGAASLASEAATGLAALWLLCWRVRADRSGPEVLPDAALTAVLLFVVTSRVLSPQYLVWLVGLAAVCLLGPATSQRPVAVLVLVACPLTALVYPIMGHGIIHGSVPGACVLAARNGVLLAAAGLSAVRLWRSTRPTAAGTGPARTEQPEPATARA